MREGDANIPQIILIRQFSAALVLVSFLRVSFHCVSPGVVSGQELLGQAPVWGPCFSSHVPSHPKAPRFVIFSKPLFIKW